jgi:RNA polymerase sigma-70 factor (ECF subfamily)
VGFLITIARNLCLNYKRDKKTYVEVEDYHLSEAENIPIFREETQQLITAAFDLLEFEYREPLILRLYDGLKYEEIADICNITVENARKRVLRAKQKVRNVLEPYFKELYD